MLHNVHNNGANETTSGCYLEVRIVDTLLLGLRFGSTKRSPSLSFEIPIGNSFDSLRALRQAVATTLDLASDVASASLRQSSKRHALPCIIYRPVLTLCVHRRRAVRTKLEGCVRMSEEEENYRLKAFISGARNPSSIPNC